MNKFDKALERINKLVEPQDDWTDEEIEHFKTVVEALKIASKTEVPDIKDGNIEKGGAE